MKPTPGPWELDDDSQRIDGIGAVRMQRVVAPNGAVVAEFSNATCNEIVYEDDGEGAGCHYDEQAIANARLIAAAPDLLASVNEFVDAFGDIIGFARGEAVMERAKAALAKARGETVK